MELNVFLKKYRSKIIFILVLSVSLISFFGGAKLMLYLSLIFISALGGFYVNSVLRVIKDYRLALKVNSILVANKQSELIIEENKQLKEQILLLNDRLKIYAKNNTRNNMLTNKFSFDED